MTRERTAADAESQAIAGLLDPARRVSAGAAHLRSMLPAEPGLYAWWAGEEGCAVLGRWLGVVPGSPIYAGQAGAGSGSTLRRRVWAQHMRGPIGSSTFRRTLAALLAEPLSLRCASRRRLEAESHTVLTAWAMENLEVAWIEVPDRAALSSLERSALRRLDPPLNLDGMPHTESRRRLRDLRRSFTAGI